jgi:hypothetical protein
VGGWIGGLPDDRAPAGHAMQGWARSQNVRMCICLWRSVLRVELPLRTGLGEPRHAGREIFAGESNCNTKVAGGGEVGRGL